MTGIYHLHFTDEKTNLEKSSNLLPNHSAITDREGMQIDVCSLILLQYIKLRIPVSNFTVERGGRKEE